MGRGLKTFFLSALLVLLTVFLIDRLVGITVRKMIPKMGRCEATSNLHYTFNEMEAPVVIIGSSKVMTDYSPSILQDNLGMDVFTSTADNSGISFQYCVADIILDRYQPKMMVLDIVPEYLFSDYCDWKESLFPFYDEYPQVNEVINDSYDWKVRMALKSNLYKYNSILPRILIRYLVNKDRTIVGYSPRESRQEGFIPLNEDFSSPEKLYYKHPYLEKIVRKAKDRDVPLVMMVSPVYEKRAMDIESNKWFKTLCDSLEVPLISNVTVEGISGRPELFIDYLHLNKDGSEIYSRYVAQQLFSFIIQYFPAYALCRIPIPEKGREYHFSSRKAVVCR